MGTEDVATTKVAVETVEADPITLIKATTVKMAAKTLTTYPMAKTATVTSKVLASLAMAIKIPCHLKISMSTTTPLMWHMWM